MKSAGRPHLREIDIDRADELVRLKQALCGVARWTAAVELKSSKRVLRVSGAEPAVEFGLGSVGAVAVIVTPDLRPSTTLGNGSPICDWTLGQQIGVFASCLHWRYSEPHGSVYECPSRYLLRC